MAGISQRILRGIVIFIPAHFTAPQEAKWMESTDYAGNPFVAGPGFGTLAQHFSQRHGVDLDPIDWPTSMVRMAIPYATSRVNVIAPDGFALPRLVQDEARKSGIEVRLVPHSNFPRQQLLTASKQYIATPISEEGFKFSEYVEHCLATLIGKSHVNLWPKY